MLKIVIDGEVAAALGERGKFGQNHNDVIRELLGLPPLKGRIGRPGTRASSSLRDIVAAGLLTPGQQLSWNRPMLGTTLYATVTTDGRMQSDGRTYGSPATCATAIAGYPNEGWSQWRTEDGTTLKELRNFVG